MSPKARHAPSLTLAVLLLGAGLLGACDRPAAPAPEAAPASTAADPSHLEYLVEIRGDQAMAWVEDRTAETLDELQADPDYRAFYEQALDALEDATELPKLTASGGRLLRVDRDAERPRGRWQITDTAGLLTDPPRWETLLDIDALAEREGENWTFSRADCRPVPETRCLVFLSPGGGDAVVMREFDLAERAFVGTDEGGFALPRAKMSVSWRDADSLFVATDLGPDSLTESGYPARVGIWRRGAALTDLPPLGEVARSAVRVYATRLHSGDAHRDLLVEVPSFFAAHYRLVDDAGGSVALPLPADARIAGLLDERLIVRLFRDWQTDAGTFTAGSVIAVPASADFAAGAIETLFAPTASRYVDAVRLGDDEVWLGALEEGVGRLLRARRDDAGRWTTTTLTLPADGSLDFVDVDRSRGELWLRHESFLTPPGLWLVAGDDAPREVIAGTPLFDAAPFEVQRRFATSADGTEVPYWVVGDLDAPGPKPVQMFSYGGFRNTLVPTYAGTYEATAGVYGRLWLERGGVFVLPNIRGGGVYGPAWHQAALGADRPRAFEDLEAVARDLVATGVTTHDRIGIEGRSNGGLLVFAAMTRAPELYGAVVSGVPLADMLRYHELLAGASWIGEYGDPRIPEERAWLAQYSPYQLLTPEADYPATFIYGSVDDDRVHPAHGRWMAARMQAQGHDVRYYESADGGHSTPVRKQDLARRLALSYTHLWRALGDAPAAQ